MVVSVRELEELYKQSYSVVDRLSAVVARIPAIAEERNLTSASSRPLSPPLRSDVGFQREGTPVFQNLSPRDFLSHLTAFSVP